MKKILLLACCVAAIACGDDDVNPMMDGGPVPDGGGIDAVVPDAGPGPDTGGGTDAGPVGNICDPESLENVTATAAGTVVTTTIDTSTATAASEMLASCGDEPTGQIVLAITIPGADANQVVAVSTDNPGTSDIDTIIDFRDVCGTEGTCFDDIAFPDNTNSLGTIVANGGDTVYALISGYGATDEGVIEVSTEILGTAGGLGDPCDERLVCLDGFLCNDTDVCEMAEPPVLSTVTAVRYDDIPSDPDPITSLGMGLTGTDANSDVESFNITFLDADGADVDFLGDGTLTFTFPFDDAEGLAMFTEAAFFGTVATAEYPATAVGFRVSLNDSSGLESNEIEGTITAGTFSVATESCDFTSLCDPAAMLVCGLTEICEVPEAPVLTAATTVRYDNLPGDPMTTLLAMGVTGTDSNGDVVAFNFTFLDAAGDDFDILGEGEPTFTFGLEEANDLASFMEAAFIGGGPTADFAPEAVGFRLSLVDSAELESNEITGTIDAGVFSAVGTSCAFTEVCDPAAMLTCNDADMCEAL